MNQVSRTLIYAAAVVALAFVAGCASAPLRTDASSAGIRAAEEVGARDVPRAALYLQLAVEEVESAKQLAKNGDDEEAAFMLKKAEADAEIALALSHENTQRLEAEKAMERVRQLMRENP